MINVKINELSSSDFYKIESNELASRAIIKAIEKPTLVFRDNKLLGAVSFRQALFRHSSFSKLKTEKIIERIPIVSKDSYLDDILYLYESGMPKAIAIQDNEKIIGIVNGESLFRYMKNKEDVSSLRAGTLSLETPNFNANETLSYAISELRRRNFPYAVVYKDKNYLGVLSSKRLAEFLTKPFRKERSFIGDTSRSSTTPKKDSIFGNMTIEGIAETIPLVSDSTNLKQLLAKTENTFLEFVAPVKTEAGIKIFSPLTAAPLVRKITTKTKFRRNIHLTKLPNLDEIDSAIAHNLIDKMYDKIAKTVEADIMLEVKFKEELSKGVKRKYRISTHLYYAGRRLQSEAQDWNLLSGLQSAFDSLFKQLKKSLV